MKKKIKYSSSDFSPTSLPQNRKEVFKDVYKVRFSLIIKCGLTLLLFAIPLIVSIVMMDLWRFGTNGYDTKQLEGFYFYWNIFLRLCVIPSLYILLVGVSGVFRIIKLLVWQEGIDFWYDFKLGVKENYKSMVIPSIFLTIIYLIYFVIFYLLFDSFLNYVVIGFMCFIFASMYLWYLHLTNVYQAKIKPLLSNSMFFFGKTIGWTLLWMVLTIWPLFIEYFQIPFMLLTFILKPVILIVLLVFYYPLLMIVSTLYSHHHFDKWINNENYHELYRKGLFNPEDYKDEFDYE